MPIIFFLQIKFPFRFFYLEETTFQNCLISMLSDSVQWKRTICFWSFLLLSIERKIYRALLSERLLHLNTIEERRAVFSFIWITWMFTFFLKVKIGFFIQQFRLSLKVQIPVFTLTIRNFFLNGTYAKHNSLHMSNWKLLDVQNWAKTFSFIKNEILTEQKDPKRSR